jgi:hypothetical protein
MDAVEIGNGWWRGHPPKSGNYLVYLLDGEMVVTPWRAPSDAVAEAPGRARRLGWLRVKNWADHVYAWRPLPEAPDREQAPAGERGLG